MTANSAPPKWKRIKIDPVLLRQLTQREDEAAYARYGCMVGADGIFCPA